MLAVVATIVPLSLHGDVPQIFVFRVYGTEIYFFILATSALSLSPRLVLWTGGASVLSLLGAWGWIISGMDTWVRWSAIEEDRTAEKYIDIVLDPDHIGAAERLMDVLLILCTATVTAAAVQRGRRLLRDQIAAEQARSRVAEIFGHYVPAEVVEELNAAGGLLTPDTREATVMFVDIEGFTRFAEGAEPERIVATLDAFFDIVSDCVTLHRGVVISLIGDAAMAAFNAPLDNPRHAADAVSAARELLTRIEGAPVGGQRLSVRIGLATGPVAAGSVGGRGLRAYTLYGDTVNLVQRLEAKNKELDSRCLISSATWAAAGSPKGFARAGEVSVPGRQDAVGAHALVATRAVSAQ